MTLLNGISTERKVRLLVIGLVTLFLVNVYRNLGMAELYLTDERYWGLPAIRFFLPRISLPIGFWGLWKLKKYGWIITAGFMTYFTFSILSVIILEIKWSWEQPALLDQTENGPMTVLNHFMGRRPISFYVGQIIVLVTLLAYMNSESIKDVFKVSRKTQVLVLGLTFLFVLLDGLLFLVFE